MLKIKSISTVGFVGESEKLIRELTSPLSQKSAGDRFYYKSSLYRVEKPDDAKVRIVVFSAVDVLCCFDMLVDLVDYQKCVLYLTDIKKAKRMGVNINKARLAYVLDCPVVFATRSTRGLNRLLEAIHTVSQTPNYIAAFENPSVAKRSVISFRKSFASAIRDKVIKFVIFNKNLLLNHI